MVKKNGCCVRKVAEKHCGHNIEKTLSIIYNACLIENNDGDEHENDDDTDK